MDIPAFRIPSPLGTAVSLLPSYPPSLVFSRVLNLALGRLIKPESLEPLHGKLIAIRVTDAGLSFFFSIGHSGFVACKGDRTPDIAFSAAAYDFLMLGLRKEDPDTLFFSRRLVVEGDTELGLIAKNALDAVEMPHFEPSQLLPGRLLERVAAHLFSSAR
jgi:predicted lipid carrier protein YhbT